MKQTKSSKTTTYSEIAHSISDSQNRQRAVLKRQIKRSNLKLSKITAGIPDSNAEQKLAFLDKNYVDQDSLDTRVKAYSKENDALKQARQLSSDITWLNYTTTHGLTATAPTVSAGSDLDAGANALFLNATSYTNSHQANALRISINQSVPQSAADWVKLVSDSVKPGQEATPANLPFADNIMVAPNPQFDPTAAKAVISKWEAFQSAWSIQDSSSHEESNKALAEYVSSYCEYWSKTFCNNPKISTLTWDSAANQIHSSDFPKTAQDTLAQLVSLRLGALRNMREACRSSADLTEIVGKYQAIESDGSESATLGNRISSAWKDIASGNDLSQTRKLILESDLKSLFLQNYPPTIPQRFTGNGSR